MGNIISALEIRNGGGSGFNSLPVRMQTLRSTGLNGWLACHMTELRSAIHPNNETVHPAHSEGGESRVHALQESARGQSQLQQENRVQGFG